MNPEESIETTSEGKNYVLLRICFFRNHSNEPLTNDEVREMYGLKDALQTRTVFEIEDESKYMLAKIKYGI
jgi:hypothetical protein